MSADSTSLPNATLSAVIAAYLQTVDAGETPDRAALLTRHAHMANDLRAFFETRDRVDAIASPLRAPAPEMPTGTKTSRVSEADGEKLAPDSSFGDYEILEEIARGGMGIVYRARQKSANRVVALKRIRGGAFVDETEMRRFRQEAETAAGLDHPNIVPLYEVGEDRGQPFFSMKLIEGGSLAQHLERYRDDPPAAARLVAQVARAVHHAHQRGILHRDLKPANILLDAGGQAYVTDFGLVKRIEGDSTLTQLGAIVGTPEYMSPEQATAQKVLTTATDVYGLGAVLYAALTGRPPFEGANVLETLRQVVEAEPVPPRALNGQVPRDLAVICLRCLHKDPSRRYGSAEAVARDLERWLRGEPIQARPVGRLEQALKWAKRRPAAAALLGVSLIAAVVLTTVVAAFSLALYEGNRDLTNANGQLTAAIDEKDETNVELIAQRNKARNNEKKANDQTAETQKALARVKEEEEKAEQRYQAARRTVMTTQLQQVGHLLQRDAVRAREALDDAAFCPLDLRDFTWAYYAALCKRDHLVLGDPAENVTDAAFSPDGRLLAVTAIDLKKQPLLRVWDVATRTQRLRLPGATRPILFSPNGQLLATGAKEGIKVWVVASGKEQATLARAREPVVFPPDGRSLLALDPQGSLRFWNLATSVAEEQMPAGDRAVTPDSRFLATGLLMPDNKTGEVHVWDLTTRRKITTVRTDNTDLPDFGKRLALAPDCKTLALATGGNARSEYRVKVKLWDVASGRLLTILSPSGTMFEINLLFSADSKVLAAHTDRNFSGSVSLWFWEMPSGRLRTSHAASRGNSLFASAGRNLAFDESILLKDTNQFQSVVTVYDFATGQRRVSIPMKLYPLSGEKRGLRLSPAGDIVALIHLGPDKTDRLELQTLDAAEDRLALPEVTPLDEAADRVQALAYTSDGRTLFVGTGGLWKRWRDTGEHLAPWVMGDPRYPREPAVARLIDTASGLTRVRFALPGFVTAAAFSSDDRILAVAHGFLDAATRRPVSEIKLWEVRSGREVRTLPGPAEFLHCLAFAPDGKTLGAGTEGTHDPEKRRVAGQVRVWDLATGRVRLTLPTPGRVYTLAFSPDGQSLAAGSIRLQFRQWGGSRTMTVGVPEHGEAKVWDVSTGRERLALRGHRGGVTALAFTVDGRMLATGSYDRTVRVWDATTGEERGVLAGHEQQIAALAFTPDGQTLTAAAGRQVKLWDVVTSQTRLTLESTGFFQAVAVSADGSRLTASSLGENEPTQKAFGARHRWDVAAGLETARLPDTLGPVALSPDGSLLATGNTPRNDDFQGLAVTAGVVKLWDSRTGQQRALLGSHALPVGLLRFTSDGRTLLSLGRRPSYAAEGSSSPRPEVEDLDDNEVKVWDVAARRERGSLKHKGEVRSLVLSRDGRLLATASGEGQANGQGRQWRAGHVQLWDVIAGRLLHTLSGSLPDVQALALSADEQTLLAFARDPARPGDRGLLQGWDVATGRQRPSIAVATNEPALVSALSPDAGTLATFTGDQITLRDTVSGKVRRTLTWSTVEGFIASLSADCKTLLTFTPGSAKLWDLATRTSRQTIPSQMDWPTLSPDGRTLLVARSNELLLWDVGTGKLRVSLGKVLAQGNVSLVEFSAGGDTVWHRSFLGQPWRYWDAATGKEKATFRNIDYSSGYPAPDGRTLVEKTPPGLRLWDVGTGQERKFLPGDIPVPYEVGNPPRPPGVFFSQDSKSIAAWRMDRDPVTKTEVPAVVLWDLATGAERRTFRDPPRLLLGGASAVGLAPSPLARVAHLRLTLEDPAPASSELDRSYRWLSPFSVTFSPDGRTLAAVTPQYTGPFQNPRLDVRSRVRLWDLSSGKLIALLSGEPVQPAGTVDVRAPSVTFSRSGRFVAVQSPASGRDGTQSHRVRVWDVSRKREVIALWAGGRGQHRPLFNQDDSTVVLVAREDTPPAGTLIGDHEVQLWDTTTGRRKATLVVGHLDMTFTPDGQTLVGTTRDGVTLWDLATGQERASFSCQRGQDYFGRQFFFPDRQTLLAVVPGGVKRWDLATGKELRALKCDHPAIVKSLGFSPDGTTLVVETKDLSRGEPTAVITRAYDVATGQVKPVPAEAKVDGPRIDVTKDSVLLWSPTLARMRDLRTKVDETASSAADRQALAQVARGRLLLRQGMLEEATTAFHEAIARRPKLAEAHFLHGVALLRQGISDDALRVLERAARLDSSLAWAFTGLGRQAAIAEGTPGPSLAALRKAIKIDPGSADAHLLLGLALARQDRPKEALAALRVAVKLGPQSAEAWWELSRLLRRQGPAQKAQDALQMAVRLQPPLAWVLADEAGTLLDQKQSPIEALVALDELVAVCPDFSQAHYLRGRALRELGKPEDAAGALRAVVRLQPELMEGHLHLALALRDRGQLADAAVALREGLNHKTVYGPPAEYRQAQEEVERLLRLDAKLPALLKGTAQPASTEERAEVARLCKYKQLYRASAEFYAATFEKQPALAEDATAGHRFAAACAAARAGQGEGDAASLGEAERTRWRKQSLDWLRAELAMKTRQVESSKPETWAPVQQSLQRWQREPNLPGLRDAAAVARLPRDEQEACRKLWAEVVALLKRIQKEE